MIPVRYTICKTWPGKDKIALQGGQQRLQDLIKSLPKNEQIVRDFLKMPNNPLNKGFWQLCDPREK